MVAGLDMMLESKKHICPNCKKNTWSAYPVYSCKSCGLTGNIKFDSDDYNKKCI